jgi:hypothetical protein
MQWQSLLDGMLTGSSTSETPGPCENRRDGLSGATKPAKLGPNPVKGNDLRDDRGSPVGHNRGNQTKARPPLGDVANTGSGIPCQSRSHASESGKAPQDRVFPNAKVKSSQFRPQSGENVDKEQCKAPARALLTGEHQQTRKRKNFDAAPLADNSCAKAVLPGKDQAQWQSLLHDLFLGPSSSETPKPTGVRRSHIAAAATQTPTKTLADM